MTNAILAIDSVINSDLVKEIIKIRIDTMWKMFALMDAGHFPDPDEEGATGVFDNKGALFIPGGLIFEDTDGRTLGKKDLNYRDYEDFSETVRYAMKYDNATFFYDDFAQFGINLPNEFLTKTAVKICNMKNILNHRKSVPGAYIPKVDSSIIARNYTPKYIYPPYGARMKVSSCLAVCRTEPQAYFLEAINYYSIRGTAEEKFWEALNTSLKPILNENGGIKIPSEIIICHTSRYGENSIVGLTRVLGLGKIGRSATITLEFVTKKLDEELHENKIRVKHTNIIAKYKKKNVVGVVRYYSTRGSINTKSMAKLREISLIDIGQLCIDLEKIRTEAFDRYYS